MSNQAPVVKKTLYAGQKYIPISNGSKVHFHFQTWTVGKDKALIDDSKKIGKKEPMVLVIGHKFKLEVWENIVKMMSVGEVASFTVKKELVYSYPFVSKTLRDLGKGCHEIKHSCTMTLQTEGIGYADLDQIVRNPCDLEFIIEVLKVESECEYEKDIWQLSEEERIKLIPELREQGNKLYAQKLYDEAEQKYGTAIGICEQLMLRERKNDDEWINLNRIKLPILLNFAQCKLVKNDYYSVIEHCNTVLEFDKENEKALFRRGKAHVGAWNPDQAEDDFNKLKKINPAMATTVDKELNVITRLRKNKEELDKDALKNLFINDVEKT